MNAQLLVAMGLVLSTWLIIFFVFVGLGLAVRRLYGLRDISADVVLSSFWMGFAVVILVLQIWHFWWPIQWTVLALLSAIALFGLVAHAASLWQWSGAVVMQRTGLVSIIALVAIWLANRAIGIGEFGDSGTYHLGTIRWATTYPIVPGLGNLQEMLAHNSSGLLYSAMLEVGPWYGRSNHLSNGLLFLAAFAQAIRSTNEVIHRGVSAGLNRVFDMVWLTPLIVLVIGHDISNPTTDPAPALVVFVFSSALLRLLETESGTILDKRQAYDIAWIAILIALSVCLKLSVAVYSASALVITLTLLILRRKAMQPGQIARVLIFSVVTGLLLVVPWMIRGIFLSGYALFPSTIITWPVEWRLPADMILREHAILVWGGRYYYAMPPPPTWSGWSWFPIWLVKVGLRDPFLVYFPLLGAAIAIYTYRRFRSKDPRPRKRIHLGWLLAIPAAVAIVFWFITFPVPRYGFAFFMVLMGITFAFAHERLERSGQQRLRRVAIALVLLAPALAIVHRSMIMAYFYRATGKQYAVSPVLQPLWNIAGTDHGFHPYPTPNVEPRVTRWGLTVYVPRNGPESWDAPLPSTHAFNKDLRLRQPGDLSSGFISDPGQ